MKIVSGNVAATNRLLKKMLINLGFQKVVKANLIQALTTLQGNLNNKTKKTTIPKNHQKNQKRNQAKTIKKSLQKRMNLIFPNYNEFLKLRLLMIVRKL